MKERIITSIALIVFLLIVGIINNRYLTELVISIITILAIFEAKNLFKIDDERIVYFLGFLSVISIFINPIFIAIVGIISIAGYIAFYQKNINLVSIGIYPFLSLMILEELYLKGGIRTILWLIIIVALTDSMAYVIGKNFGKKFINRQFSPTSPNKTWEGVIGGIVSGSIIGAFAGMMFYNFFIALMVALFISIASVFGDLFESFLKRKAGLKDSGNILPGHGGVLDRVDGYLFAAPLLWAIFLALGTI